MTSAYGLHLVAVEVDVETGALASSATPSPTTSAGPSTRMLVDGQIVGGLAQGLGAALLEELAYDDAASSSAARSWTTSCPAAGEMPPLELWVPEEAPTPTNPLGVKGAGEGGIVAAGGAIANAVADALAPLGVEIRSLPLRPSRLRELIRAAAAARA